MASEKVERCLKKKQTDKKYSLILRRNNNRSKRLRQILALQKSHFVSKTGIWLTKTNEFVIKLRTKCSDKFAFKGISLCFFNTFRKPLRSLNLIKGLTPVQGSR